MLCYFTPDLYHELTRVMHALHLPVRDDRLVRRQWFPLEESIEDAVRYDPYIMKPSHVTVTVQRPRSQSASSSSAPPRAAQPGASQPGAGRSSTKPAKKPQHKKSEPEVPSWTPANIEDNFAYQFAKQALRPNQERPCTLPLRMEKFHYYSPPSTIQGRMDANQEFLIVANHEWNHNVAYTRGSAATVTLAGSGTANVLSCAGRPFIRATSRDLAAPFYIPGNFAIYPSDFPGYRGYRLVGKGTAANVFSVKIATYGILSHEVIAGVYVRNISTGTTTWSQTNINLTAGPSVTIAIGASLAAEVEYSLQIWFTSTAFVAVPFEMEFYGAGDIGFPNHKSFCEVAPVPDIPSRSDTGIVAFQSLWFQNTSSSLNNGGEIVGYRSPVEWTPPNGIPLYEALSNANCNYYTGPAKHGCYGWALLPEAEDYRFEAIGARVLDKPQLIITGKLQAESEYQIIIDRGVYHWGASRTYAIFSPDDSMQLDLVRHALSTEPAFMSNDKHVSTIRKILQKVKRIVMSPTFQTGAAALASLI